MQRPILMSVPGGSDNPDGNPDDELFRELSDLAVRWSTRPVSSDSLTMLCAIDRASARHLEQRPRLLRSLPAAAS
jgi:hypothetical protein